LVASVALLPPNADCQVRDELQASDAGTDRTLVIRAALALMFAERRGAHGTSSESVVTVRNSLK
jgi:hypothetical protein